MVDLKPNALIKSFATQVEIYSDLNVLSVQYILRYGHFLSTDLREGKVVGFVCLFVFLGF